MQIYHKKIQAHFECSIAKAKLTLLVINSSINSTVDSFVSSCGTDCGYSFHPLLRESMAVTY